MNYLLFGLEILPIVMGIALVPARSELRISLPRDLQPAPGVKNPALIAIRKIVNARSGMDL